MEMHDYLKFAASFVFVLSLMGGLSYILKRFNFGHAGMMSPSKKRLKLVEILPLDGRRKAILIQRDNTQHLVILGASGETVIEKNIEPPKDTAIE